MARITNLNVQGMSRRDKSLMSCIVADPGQVVVSSDCYPKYNTEFLTESGWKKFDEIAEGEKIWQVDKSSLTGSWVVPKRRIDKLFTGNLVQYNVKRGSLTVTEGHKMLWVGQQAHKRTDKALWRNVTYAGQNEELKSIQHFAHFSHSDTVSQYEAKDIWMACMLHADGSLVKGKKVTYRVQVSRPRKREKLAELLGTTGQVNKEIRPCHTMHTETWLNIEFHSPLLKGKEFDLSTLGGNQADLFVSALMFWDGSKSANSERTKRVTWGTVKKDEAEKVQSYLVRSGYEARIAICKKAPPNQDYYHLSIKKLGCTRFAINPRVAPSGVTTVSVKHLVPVTDFPVVCFEVDTGFLIVRQHGQVFVSGNCSAGEPSVLAHYSQDINYRLATVDRVGKQPYLDSNGMLIIDDIYLMVASRYPDWKAPIQDAFNATYDGKTFAEKWLEDSDYLAKKVLGSIRGQAKIYCLGISYSMGPKKLVLASAQNGFDLSLKEARAFYRTYWDTFPRVKLLSDKLQAMHSKQGYLINDFGFVLYPDSPHKCLNYLIQSSVTGVMHVFKKMVFTKPELLQFLVEVHDETLISIPEDRLVEAKEYYFQCVDELNRMLNWSVKMRFGWVEGKNWYGAK